MKIALTEDPSIPADRIAQAPSQPRDSCRLLVYESSADRVRHAFFRDLPVFLQSGDALVLNESLVQPARLFASKPTGGRVEILLLGPGRAPLWNALLKPSVRPGTALIFPGGERARITGRSSEGEIELDFEGSDPVSLMNRHGIPPLPPYIKRARDDEKKKRDPDWYQTVYASVPGSVAAPTAGLHFTERLLDRIREKGVLVVSLTLHIGWGTFRPILSDRLENHRMLPERFQVTPSTVEAILKARRQGRRIVGVGTSVTRALESCWDPEKGLAPGSGASTLFIHPPRPIRALDGLITNFHLPRSTPLALVDAFIGRKARLTLYREALENGYRFYSYGDAMLALR